MKILVLGSGAKDSAVAWWFSKSRLIDGLYVAPGNPGTAEYAQNLDKVNPSNPKAVYKACTELGIDFVCIGTEEPLVAGVQDYLIKKGISVAGTPGYAMKLESDRCFARDFARRYGIPTPQYVVFDKIGDLKSYLKKNGGSRYCIKKNGLSPSRLMIDSDDTKALVDFAKGLISDGPVILEEHIDGIPITVTVFMDGKGGSLCLPFVSEYTKSDVRKDGEATGGMGAVCPVVISNGTSEMIYSQIINPTLDGLNKEGLAYRGVLTFSMAVDTGRVVLFDYHVRLNDPATQALVPTIANDLVEIMQALLENRLSDIRIQLTGKSAVAVVIASDGYPQTPRTDDSVDCSASMGRFNVSGTMPHVFFGAVKNKNGKIVTSGGRAATVVGVGNNITEANSAAYRSIDTIRFDGAWYRADMGNRFFENSAK